MGEFEKENAFVLLVARGTLSKEEKIKFEDLLSADLDWDYVLAQLKRHKLLPLFTNYLHSCRIATSLENIINDIKNSSNGRIVRSRILDMELGLLAKSLEAKNITYAVLKGPVLAHTIYGSPDKRTYADLDILVKKSELDIVTDIIQGHGYIQGEFDQDKQNIVPTPRKNVVGCSIYLHQLYPFRKIIDQDLYTVEVQTDFFPQYRKTGTSQHTFDIDLSATSECWQTLSLVEINGTLISTLNWKYFLLQLCLHAYTDEMSISSIVAAQKSGYQHGSRLRAYCDVRELIKEKIYQINLEEFVNLVQQTKTNKPIYYILSNLTKIYPDSLEKIEYILDKIHPINLSFMNEFGNYWETINHERGKFSQSFLQRLFNNSFEEDYEKQKYLFSPIVWT
jgi:hypothetical protein